MPDIELEPRKHSHLYEIKPMSRWWLTVPALGCALGVYVNGFTNPVTWALLFVGALLAVMAVLCMPRFWLSKFD